MNPIFLSIEGLNSFYQKQDIDFTRLTRRKLFGIFGPTGSGKSTVLDAITLALYDQIARYDGRKGKEFIHMASERCGVEFTFSLVEGGEVYTVFRSYKLHKDSYKTLQARFVKEEEVLAEGTLETNKAILQVIGLGYEDFTRSVLLPQGKFSEFLLLTGAERSQMLERIFHLEKYGTKLMKRLKSALTEQKLEENTVQTQIAELGSVHSKQLAQVEAQWQEGLAKERNLKATVLKNREQLQLFTQQYTILKEKQLVQEKLKSWSEKKAAVEKKKADLINYKKAAELAPLLLQFQQTRSHLEESQLKAGELNIRFEQLGKEFEKTKNRYDLAVQAKQERYPVLLQKREKIEQALQLAQEIEEKERERGSLLQSYQGQQQQMKQQTALLQTAMENKRRMDEEINGLQKQAKELFVSFQAQQSLEEKAKLQKAVLEMEAKKKEMAERRSRDQKEIHAMKEKDRQHWQQLLKQKQKITSLQNELEAIDLEIDAMEEQLSLFLARMDSEKETAILNQKRAQLDEWKNKLALLEKKIFKSKENLEKTIVSWETANDNIASLQQQEKKLLQLYALQQAASSLKDSEPCPVCGATHHPRLQKKLPPAPSTAVAGLNEAVEEKEALFQQVLSCQGEYEGLLSMKAQWLSQMKAVEKILAEGLQAARESPYEKLKQKKECRRQLQNAYDEAERQYQKHQQENAVWKARLEQKGNSLAQWERDNAGWLEEYESQKALLAQHLCTDGNMNYIKELELVYGKIKRRETLEKGLTEAINRRESVQKEQDRCQQQLFDLQKALEVVKEKGLEKKESLERLKDKLKELTGGQQAALWQKMVEDEIAKLLSEEKDITILWQKMQEAYKKASEEKKELAGQMETYQKMARQQEESFMAACEKAGFSGEEEMIRSHTDKETLTALENEILAFEQEGAVLQNRMQQFTETAVMDMVTAEMLEQRQKELAAAEKELEEITKEVILLKSSYDNIGEKLEKLKNYQARQKIIQHKKELLEDLGKLVQGNAFVHYIANKQLLYVAQEATSRLKYMTHGRYAIEIENGEFYVRDDLNGGVTRSVRTLSGGEIFVTSFALALALSDRIQMKNNVPIQTFFLDEGFGSLDPGMLDTVMDSLESLYEEDLKVGVISHVEELKNRIPVRLEIFHHKDSYEGAKAVIY